MECYVRIWKKRIWINNSNNMIIMIISIAAPSSGDHINDWYGISSSLVIRIPKPCAEPMRCWYNKYVAVWDGCVLHQRKGLSENRLPNTMKTKWLEIANQTAAKITWLLSLWGYLTGKHFKIDEVLRAMDNVNNENRKISWRQLCWH